MDGESPISSAGLELALKTWLGAQIRDRKLSPPKVEWVPKDPELKLLRPLIEWCADHVIELYFPERSGPMNVHYVGGGLSGTPLVCIDFEGDPEKYYLKFFEQEGEFKAEWNGHKSALAWLGEYTVELRAIPGVAGDARRQLEALRCLNDRLAAAPAAPAKRAPGGPTKRPPLLVAALHKRLYPVCYGSARVSKTLKARYQAAGAVSNFPQDAYKEIIHVLKITNPKTKSRRATLSKCPDYGPPVPAGARNTILNMLQSDVYDAFIEHARQDLSRWEAACEGSARWWSDGLLLLKELLAGPLPGKIEQQYELVLGHIHGDANSRNFLFGTDPSRLQVIDCGCHAADAPLLFDLAQIESDLKVNLMASEAVSGYEEIDVGQLPLWIEMEKLVTEHPFIFKIPASMPASVKRAYGIVKAIRLRLGEIPPRDVHGQADPTPYFYFLLYWTLRKLRHPAVPPTKRLFAMASVFLLLERLQ
jgi:hypothetical protein